MGAAGAAMCGTSSASAAASASERSNVPSPAELIKAALDARSDTIRVPPGRYVLTEPIRLATGHRPSLTLDLSGVDLVFSGITPARNLAFVHVQADAPGQTLTLRGLTVRLDRSSVRTPGSDMIRLAGFASYEVQGLRVLSADNMGLCIGRGDPFSFAPESISIVDCEFGGWAADMPHSHASIGDTAIWIVTPARRTTVRRCRIEHTGDDAIFVGHSASAAIREVTIEANSIARCSGGIGVAVPHARIIGNHIRRTNNAAIRCEVQNGNQASNCLIAGNTIIDAGQLEAGELGQQMIPKWHPHAIWVYQGGGRIRIEDNTIRRCRGSGFVLMPHHEQGSLSDVRIQGGRVDGVGVDDAGRALHDSVRHAVIRRASVAGHAVRGLVAADIAIHGLVQPLLVWINRECADDGPPVLERMRLQGARLDREPLVYWEGTAFARGRAEVSYTSEDSVIARPLQTAERWPAVAPGSEGGFHIVGH